MTRFPHTMHCMSHPTAEALLPSLQGMRVWLVGAGGTGMCGLAQLLHAAGAVVCGEDVEDSEAIDRLRTDGMAVTIGHACTLPNDVQRVVATAAAPSNHPTLLAARARGIPIHTYAHMLGLLHQTRTGISVAGTHGKSTTTCLLTWCLLRAGLDPGFIAGATCDALGGNARAGALRVPVGPLAGQPGLLVTESCEFDRSFHQLHPVAAIVTNIEADHLDCYGSLEEVVESFSSFACQLPSATEGGYLLLAHEGAHREAVTEGVSAKIETFGLHANATHRVEISDDGTVRVIHKDGETLQWKPRLIGSFNALNGAAAGIMALHFGAKAHAVQEALADFAGLERRQQFVGCARMPFGDVRIMDDYAHHPTEIRVTLKALRQSMAARRLICVFQPHQHSRTRLLLDDFATSFCDADHVLLPEIYFVRDPETERDRVNSQMLAKRIVKQGVDAEAFPTFDAVIGRLRTTLQPGDVVVTMGAGPVWRIARAMVAGNVSNHDS